MKRRHAVLVAVIIAALAGTGCNKAAPTEPDRGYAVLEPEKVAAPPLGPNLSGAWAGTITFHPYQDNGSGLACSGSASFSVVLEQGGSQLTGQFPSGCAGVLTIRGIVAGSGISGSLDGSVGTLGRISGTVSASKIAFQTKVHVGGDDNEPTHKGGVQTVVSSDVELERENPIVRAKPLMVGGSGRPTRIVAPRP